MTDKAKLTQIEKYGGEEQYRAEMRRRRGLVKTPGFASMDADKHKELSRKGGQNRWKNRNDKTEEGRGPS